MVPDGICHDRDCGRGHGLFYCCAYRHRYVGNLYRFADSSLLYFLPCYFDAELEKLTGPSLPIALKSPFVCMFDEMQDGFVSLPIYNLFLVVSGEPNAVIVLCRRVHAVRRTLLSYPRRFRF